MFLKTKVVFVYLSIHQLFRSHLARKAHTNMVSKALILFLVGAQAGIYPDNHWDFSTELTADSADAFVKDNVDAGKTASWSSKFKGHGNQEGTCMEMYGIIHVTRDLCYREVDCLSTGCIFCFTYTCMGIICLEADSIHSIHGCI